MLAVSLDRSASDPLGTQLAHQIRRLVTTGALASGARLPSTRALAADLGVARAVVEQAYAQLVAEGWLHARRGAGTTVAPASALPQRPPATSRRAARAPELIHLGTGTPYRDRAQEQLWRRAWREVSAATPPRGYADHRGLPELREALAERLGQQRGLAVSAEDLRITSGTTDGLRQLLAVLGPGGVLVDDPGYRAAALTVHLAGRRVHDHPALAPVGDLAGCAAAYVTPAHHHPLGPVLSGPDRVALLGAARAADALVVEDDYDSEFRFEVAPIPALASLDRDRVAYLGTASKAVSPGLRLGWMVPPAELLPAIDAHREVLHESASWPAQRAFVTLLRDGYIDRCVRAARAVYAERAARVAAAFPAAVAHGPLAGMYAAVELPREAAGECRRAAAEAGFDLPLLADYCRTHVRHGIVVGFGGISDAEFERAIRVLASVA